MQGALTAANCRTWSRSNRETPYVRLLALSIFVLAAVILVVGRSHVALAEATERPYADDASPLPG